MLCLVYQARFGTADIGGGIFFLLISMCVPAEGITFTAFLPECALLGDLDGNFAGQGLVACGLSRCGVHQLPFEHLIVTLARSLEAF